MHAAIARLVDAIARQLATEDAARVHDQSRNPPCFAAPSTPASPPTSSPPPRPKTIATCSTRARREGWEIANIYTDAAISGASNGRPGMTAMLADASAGAFDIVLAEALDRIARNQADIATIFQRLEFADVANETLTEGRIRELPIGLKGTMGALFLKDLVDKIRRGQKGVVGRGPVPGGLTYGYEVVSQLNARGELDWGLRRIHLAQAAVVLRVYHEYVAGSSPKMIAKRLNADGIPSPRGGEWRASTLSGNRERGIGVLCNPVYAG